MKKIWISGIAFIALFIFLYPRFAALASGGEDFPKRIALTFDDGPHPVYTRKLLDGLKERNVHATFFLMGKHADENPELVRQMVEDGHLVGNHTYNHVELTKLSDIKACRELKQTNEAIFKASGMVAEYIRPPFGAWRKSLDDCVDMTTVFWNIDPLDWKIQNKGSVVNRVMKYAAPDKIILLHDIFSSSVDAALEIVDKLQADGYTFVTVEELILD